MDEFRPINAVVDGFNIPFGSAPFRAARAIYRLPLGAIKIQRTFPRIAEARISTTGPIAIVPMESAAAFLADGLPCDDRVIILLRGSPSLHFVETRANLFGVVCFVPSGLASKWPAMLDAPVFLRVQPDAIESLRNALFEIVRGRAQEAHRSGAEDLEAALLTTFDAAISGAVMHGTASALTRARYVDIVKQVDGILAGQGIRPPSNDDVAREVGVSNRTLHEAVTRVRGLGLHRYIRLRRLWSARRQLIALAEQAHVGPIARANGFRHMGEFAAAYRAAFGEAPSATAARVRTSDWSRAPFPTRLAGPWL